MKKNWNGTNWWNKKRENKKWEMNKKRNENGVKWRNGREERGKEEQEEEQKRLEMMN